MKVIFVAAFLLTILQVMAFDYDFTDEEAFQNEETYRYVEKPDSETLTLQDQSGLYVIGKASVISGQSNEDCKKLEGAIKEYRLQLSKKPCSRSYCQTAVKEAEEFLLEEYPGCIVKRYGPCYYGPDC